MNIEKILRGIIDNADDTGCTDGLTVVNGKWIKLLKEYLDKPLTKKQKKGYNYNPDHCPKCDDHDIVGYTDFDSDGYEVWAKVSCNKCGYCWTDGYKFEGIMENGDVSEE